MHKELLTANQSFKHLVWRNWPLFVLILLLQGRVYQEVTIQEALSPNIIFVSRLDGKYLTEWSGDMGTVYKTATADWESRDVLEHILFEKFGHSFISYFTWLASFLSWWMCCTAHLFRMGEWIPKTWLSTFGLLTNGLFFSSPDLCFLIQFDRFSKGWV